MHVRRPGQGTWRILATGRRYPASQAMGPYVKPRQAGLGSKFFHKVSDING